MKTEIFENYTAFLQRKDNSINGVSPEFAKRNPDYAADNQSNQRCWNCTDCIDCAGCEHCWNCTDCTDCAGCKHCWNCTGLRGINR